MKYGHTLLVIGTNLGLSDPLILDVFFKNRKKQETAEWMRIHLSKIVNYADKKRTNATVKLV